MPRSFVTAGDPHTNTNARARAARKATEELTMFAARRHVRSALSIRNTPDATSARTLVLGALAIVLHKSMNKCDGPFHVVHIHGDAIKIHLTSPTGPFSFRTTVVRTYITDQPLPMALSIKFDDNLLRPTSDAAVTSSPPVHSEELTLILESSELCTPDPRLFLLLFHTPTHHHWIPKTETRV